MLLRARSSLILAFFLLEVSCRRPVRQPNVLIVTVDTLRADHLGCYGFTLAQTPRIDSLAKEGVLCSDAIAAAPITLPSHCSIMTGLFPPAHGVRDNGTYALGDKAVTLAERLKGAGYETRAFVSALVLNRRYNLNQGFDSYDDDLWAEDVPKLFMIRERPARKTADKFLDWFGKRAATGAPPFFAWVHFFDPHQPYKAETRDRVLAPSPYDAEIAGVDRAVGRLLDALKAANVLDDTLVILTADHGESLGEHGEKTHAIFIYDATLRVPLLVRYPRVFRHTTYSGPVRSVDIVPTVLSVLGLPGGNETQGVDLVRAFRGDVPPPDLIQYSESLLSEVGFGMAPLAGIRHGGYKWIRAPRPELYDLKNDPHELRNLLPAEARRGAVMDQDLSRILDESARRALTAKESPMSRETQEALLSLGYLTPAADRKSMGGIDPKDGIVLYNELEDARHLAQNNRWGQAEKQLRAILAKQPTHLSARNILALTLLQQGKFEEARAEYLVSLTQDPKQSRVLGMLGSIAILENHLDDAERLYKGALEITPGFVEAMCNLGFVASLKGQDAAAQEWFARALAMDPGFPRPWRLSADLYYERGDFAKARQNYAKVLEKEPSDFESLIQLGNCERRLANDPGAVAAFQRAEKLRPDSWIPAYNRACLDSIRGRSPEAVALLETAAGKGLSDPGLLTRDHDLDPLRKMPEFAAITRKVEASAKTAAEDD